MFNTITPSSIKYIDSFALGHDYNYSFKCLMLGDSAAGKSCLCERQVEKSFDQTRFILTCGVDFKLQAFEWWDSKVIKLQIWDTAGQERFRAITQSYYKGANGVMLCYDTTDPTSAENIKMWLAEVEKFAPADTPIVLCGTKSDLQAEPHMSENIRLAGEIVDEILESYPEIKHHCLTSSKTGAGVEDAYMKLVDEMMKHVTKKKLEEKDETLKGDTEQTWGSMWNNACSLVKKPYSSIMSGSCSS